MTVPGFVLPASNCEARVDQRNQPRALQVLPFQALFGTAQNEMMSVRAFFDRAVTENSSQELRGGVCFRWEGVPERKLCRGESTRGRDDEARGRVRKFAPTGRPKLQETVDCIRTVGCVMTPSDGDLTLRLVLFL